MNFIKMLSRALFIFSLITPLSTQLMHNPHHMIYVIPAAYNKKTGKYMVSTSDKDKISGPYKSKKFMFEGKTIQESDITYTSGSEFNNIQCNWLGECKLTYLTATLIKN